MNTLFVLSFALAICCITGETVPPGSPAYLNDNNALNYALTLEHLESAFYNRGFQALTEANFTNAGVNTTFYNFLKVIQDHESMHVLALIAVLQARNAAPVLPCNYTFTYPNVSSFLAVADALENTGVSAYLGAITTLTDTNLLTFAATVATVEARHASFLNLITGMTPYPNRTDVAKPPADILPIALQFIYSCPQNLTLPIDADNFRNQTYTNQTVYAQNGAAYANDNVALNYALTLENLEAAFYTLAFSKLNASTFAAAGINGSYYNYLLLLKDHEDAHVAALRMVLSARGADPVPPCTYNFTFNDVPTFLTIAAALENTGVSAYDGAAAAISDKGLLQYAASIATVEARHAAFLNLLTGVIPFPNVTDAAFSPATVLGIAGQFIVSCNYTITAPLGADAFRLTTGTATGSSTGATGATGSATGATGAGATGATGSATGSATGNTDDDTGSATAGNTDDATSDATSNDNPTSTTGTAQDSSAVTAVASIVLVALTLLA